MNKVPSGRQPEEASSAPTLPLADDAPSRTINLSAIPPGKIRCFITEKLRDDKPEEQVRQRVARALVEEYGYKKADIAIGG